MVDEIDASIEDWGVVEFFYNLVNLMVNDDSPRLLCIREMLRLETKYGTRWDRLHNGLLDWESEITSNECSWETLAADQNKSMTAWMGQFLFYSTLYRSVEYTKKSEFKMVALYSTLSGERDRLTRRKHPPAADILQPAQSESGKNEASDRMQRTRKPG